VSRLALTIHFFTTTKTAKKFLKGVGKIFSKIFLTGGVGATPPRKIKDMN
jgi:hypothetical protein